MLTTELPGLTGSTSWKAKLSAKSWLVENWGPEDGAVAWAAIVDQWVGWRGDLEWGGELRTKNAKCRMDKVFEAKVWESGMCGKVQRSLQMPMKIKALA
jgi:hypothetical protein